MSITCTKCPLSESRTHIVWGDGPIPCHFMIIGEAPGEQEDISGVPFSGPAGLYLDHLLSYCGLTRRDVYVTNLVRCRPPNNRDPRPSELAMCANWLDEEIERVNPSRIVLVSRFAIAKWFPGEKVSMIHGVPRARDVGGVRRILIPMYHPAAALHNPTLRPVIDNDWATLPQKLANIDALPIDYCLIHSADGDVRVLALDTESADDELLCITLSPEAGQAVLLYGDDTQHLDISTNLLVMQNSKYDLRVLKKAGLLDRVRYNYLADTMLAAYLLSEESLGLKELAVKWLGEDMQRLGTLLAAREDEMLREYIAKCLPLATSLSKRLAQSLREVSLDVSLFSKRAALRKRLEELCGPCPEATPRDLPVLVLLSYACADADMTGRLWPRLERELDRKELLDMFWNMEMPLVPILIAMEDRGIKLDIPYLAKLDAEFAVREEELRGECVQLAGRDINIASDQQVASLLFDEWGETPTKTTEAGRYSVSALALSSLSHIPFVKKLLEWREMSKLRSTYTSKLPLMVDASNRIHAEFNQVTFEGHDEGLGATTTGRLSSRNPNLQNIPARTEDGLRIREAFITDEGWSLLSADYAQIEPRIMAHLSNDASLIEAFNNDEDVYRYVSRLVFGTEDRRDDAKPLLLGTNYGLTPYGLAERTGMSVGEAEAIIKEYLEMFPGIAEYMRSTVEFCQLNGYVRTLWGRRRYIPDINNNDRGRRVAAERMAINMPIQGTAADIIKRAMVTIGANDPDWHMLLQVHDELLFEVRDSFVAQLTKLVEYGMIEAASLVVPLRVSIGVGRHWGLLK